jgi:hypothetical protein
MTIGMLRQASARIGVGSSVTSPRSPGFFLYGGYAVSKQEIFAEAIAAFYPDGKDRATLEILETSRRLS